MSPEGFGTISAAWPLAWGRKQAAFISGVEII
jgi:hypothetical protein